MVSAAAQFGQIQFPLLVAERAIAALFDSVRQIFCDVFLQSAQQQRTQFRRQSSPRNSLFRFGIFAALRFVSVEELLLITKIAGLDEIHDAPQIEQAIFERRAGQRDFIFALQLLDRLRDLRAGILDELRLVENHCAEGELLQLLQITPQQRVIRDDDVVLRNLFAQIMPRRAAFEDEHFHVRREAFRFAPPVVQNGRGTNHERRLGVFLVLLLEPRKPCQRLQCFSKAHVVGKDAAEPDLDKVREEIEAVLLIRAQVGL